MGVIIFNIIIIVMIIIKTCIWHDHLVSLSLRLSAWLFVFEFFFLTQSVPSACIIRMPARLSYTSKNRSPYCFQFQQLKTHKRLKWTREGLDKTKRKFSANFAEFCRFPNSTFAFSFIGRNVDFTGVVSTVGGGGVLRGEKNHTHTQKTVSGCGGGWDIFRISAEEGRGYGG